jgi:hypothetical protein
MQSTKQQAREAWLMEVLYVNFSHYMCQRGLYNAYCNAPPHVVELDKNILPPNCPN